MAKKKDTEALDLKTILSQVNKKYGKGTLGIAASSSGVAIPRISFGVFALDYVTGGGVPYGRITGFHGMRSCGKTSNALRIVSSAQTYCREHLCQMIPTQEKLYVCPECGSHGDGEGEICPFCDSIGYESTFMYTGQYKMVCPECKEYNPMKAAWFDLEGAFQGSWAAKFGVDCSQLILSRPESAESCIDMIDAIMKTREVDLFVIDSVANLTPLTESDESMENNQVGLQARMVNKMLRKFGSAMNKSGVGSAWRPTVILINQIRQKVGVMYGSPDTLPGGLGQEFATSVDIKFNPSKIESDKVGNPQFQLSTFRCVKNKCSTPHRAGSFRMWLDYDDEGHYPTDTEEIAVVLGIANSAGLLGDSKEGWKVYDKGFKSRKEAALYVLSDLSIYRQIRSDLLQYRFGQLDTTKGHLNVQSDSDSQDTDSDVE